ncbi:MAG: hypothetical protein ACI9G1_005516, partial [Pirellulaceae bacterium]
MRGQRAMLEQHGLFLGSQSQRNKRKQQLKKRNRVKRAIQLESLESRIVLSGDLPAWVFDVEEPSQGFSSTDTQNVHNEVAELRTDSFGNEFYVEPELDEAGLGEPALGDEPVFEAAQGDDTLFASYDLSQTFNLHSRPNAALTIYLDFDGHTTSGTSWNNGRGDINTPSWSLDGDASSFSTSEQQTVQRIWARVSEDFAPFEVNVTTEDPGAAALIRTNNSDTEYGIRVV